MRSKNPDGRPQHGEVISGLQAAAGLLTS